MAWYSNWLSALLSAAPQLEGLSMDLWVPPHSNVDTAFMALRPLKNAASLLQQWLFMHSDQGISSTLSLEVVLAIVRYLTVPEAGGAAQEHGVCCHSLKLIIMGRIDSQMLREAQDVMRAEARHAQLGCASAHYVHRYDIEV